VVSPEERERTLTIGDDGPVRGEVWMVAVRDRPARSPRLRWASTAGWFAAFVLLTGCVALDVTEGLDLRVYAWARPRDEWALGQVRWAPVVHALRPSVMAAAVAAVAGAVCLVRRTVRPAIVAAAAVATAALVTLLVKVALARPDPHSTGSGHGGSFPSGHTVGVVLGVALVVHLLAPRAVRGLWVGAAAAGLVMGIGLVVIGAHWASDVVGGLLLGFAVLAGVTAIDGGAADDGRAAGERSS
jgi:membrane-associated phospholipid phosphatase